MKKYFFLLDAHQVLAHGERGKLQMKKLEEKPDKSSDADTNTEGFTLEVWGTIEAKNKNSAMKKLEKYKRKLPFFSDF